MHSTLQQVIQRCMQQWNTAVGIATGKMANAADGRLEKYDSFVILLC